MKKLVGNKSPLEEDVSFAEGKGVKDLSGMDPMPTPPFINVLKDDFPENHYFSYIESGGIIVRPRSRNGYESLSPKSIQDLFDLELIPLEVRARVELVFENNEEKAVDFLCDILSPHPKEFFDPKTWLLLPPERVTLVVLQRVDRALDLLALRDPDSFSADTSDIPIENEPIGNKPNRKLSKLEKHQRDQFKRLRERLEKKETPPSAVLSTLHTFLAHFIDKGTSMEPEAGLKNVFETVRNFAPELEVFAQEDPDVYRLLITEISEKIKKGYGEDPKFVVLQARLQSYFDSFLLPLSPQPVAPESALGNLSDSLENLIQEDDLEYGLDSFVDSQIDSECYKTYQKYFASVETLEGFIQRLESFPNDVVPIIYRERFLFQPRMCVLS